MKVRRKLGYTLCSILFKKGLQSHTILSETKDRADKCDIIKTLEIDRLNSNYWNLL